MRAHVQAFLAAVLLLGAGCYREHLAPGFGRAYAEAMAMQTPSPAKPPPAPSMKLDTQEAQVVGESYIRGLSGKNAKGEPEPVVYVSQQPPMVQQQQLAPSVPKP